jgi:GDP-mannose transporter
MPANPLDLYCLYLHSRTPKLENVRKLLSSRLLNLTNHFEGFPISLLLVAMTYTSAKALQYLSVPIYTIFKNLTIIVIAYGEVLLFKSLVSRTALFSFGLMVLSSVVAAWADISHAAKLTYDRGLMPGLIDSGNGSGKARLEMLNIGYAWMGLNVLCSAGYVLGMRRVIKNMGFRDWDSESFMVSLQKKRQN